jgi:ATP-dependent helicase HrpB
MTSLPIDALLPELLDRLRASPSLVLEAPPGAGKTTRVPRALLGADFLQGREIVVLEPRRLAARLAARRVAEELGELIGGQVGYQVRFDEQSGPSTRLRFVTEGLFARQLLFDPRAAKVGAVLIDEFHERHLAGDFVLATARHLQRTTRPDLKLVVMSATLPGEEVARYLHDVPRLRSEGRRFPVEIEHASQPDARPIEQQVASAVGRLLAEEPSGDLLVFLPGAAEIRRCQRECSVLAARHNADIFPLHGELPAEEQDAAIRPGPRRKVILSTNVAETSITIEGVRAVIDSGLARVASFAAWSGLPALKLQKISRSSATQRAGRAGRTGPGRCLRLFTQHDHDTRAEQDSPEIARLDLCELALSLCGTPLSEDFWLTPPNAAAWESAQTLLQRLGAIDSTRALTPLGEAMRKMPTHPRLARVILAAAQDGHARPGAALAALLNERDLRSRKAQGPSPSADPLDLLALFSKAEEARFHPGTLQHLGIDANAARAVSQAQKQVLKSLPGAPRAAARPLDESLRRALLAGFSDRAGILRTPPAQRSAREIVLAFGGSAEVLGDSLDLPDGWALAIDAESRSTARGTAQQARLLCPVSEDWIVEDRWDEIEEKTSVQLVGDEGRVEAKRRVLFGSLALEESPATASHEEALRALREGLSNKGPQLFLGEDLVRLRGRAKLLSEYRPELAPDLSESALLEAGAALCAETRRLSSFSAEGLVSWVLAHLGTEQRRALEELTPERIILPGGRRAPIEYPADAPPFASSRLQDFFGMRQGPSILGGKLPLVLHLLAPNGRAVQVTTDLKGFWEKHYPGVAKELRRRYPRHSWPDNPLEAEPPAPGGRGHR